MEVSPFPHAGPLKPDQVNGRDDLLADLTERVTERRPTALLGPRRFGKTSVLGRLSADLTEVRTVWVDLFGVQTHADLATRLATALGERAATEVRDHAAELSVRAGVDLAQVGAALRLSRRSRPDARLLYDDLVRVLVGLAGRVQLLVIFDEFQDIAAIDGATAVLRTALQHHYTELGLVFAGSQPSAMRDIFARHDQPFFNQADIVTIGPLSAEAVHDTVSRGFRETGRQGGGVAALIHRLTGGHPQRTMQAADAVWRRTGPDEAADELWGEALIALRESERHYLAATYADLHAGEQKVVRLAAHDEPMFGATAGRLGLSRGAAAHARDALLADGKVREDDGGGLAVTDPLLADWVRQQLPL